MLHITITATLPSELAIHRVLTAMSNAGAKNVKHHLDEVILTPTNILQAIESTLGLTREHLASDVRKRELVIGRWIAGYLMLKAGVTMTEICRLLCRDHATILYYSKQWESRIEYDAEFRLAATKVTEELGVGEMVSKK